MDGLTGGWPSAGKGGKRLNAPGVVVRRGLPRGEGPARAEHTDEPPTNLGTAHHMELWNVLHLAVESKASTPRKLTLTVLDKWITIPSQVPTSLRMIPAEQIASRYCSLLLQVVGTADRGILDPQRSKYCGRSGHDRFL